MRDDKCYNYAETKVEIYTDNILVTDNEETKPTLKTTLINPNRSLENDRFGINNIKNYALLEKEQKRKAQIGKKNRKTKHLSK